MYTLGLVHCLRGAGGALVAAYLCGFGLWFLQRVIPFGGLLTVLLLAGVGYVVGEATTRATPRKRGTWLGVVAAVALVVGLALAGATILVWSGSRPARRRRVRLRDARRLHLGIIGLVVAIAVALSRVR